MNDTLRAKWSSFWFYGAAAMCLVLVAATAAQWPSLRFLNLKIENNLAAWWSGILLLLVAIHAFDGWVLYRKAQPKTAWAWLSISAIVTALSLDEIGSIHERVDRLLNLGTWWSLLPFALILFGMLVFALASLASMQEHRPKTLGIGLGFFLFGMVAVLEHVGDIGEWSTFGQRLRGTVEEATELLGMLVLLKVSMTNTRGLFDRQPNRQSSPTLDVISHRVPVLVAGAIVSPFLAFLTARLPDQQRGHPSDWFAAAIFVFAGLAAIRGFLKSGQKIGISSWGLLVFCGVASIGTTLDPRDGVDLSTWYMNKRLLVFIVASLLTWVAWALDPKHGARRYAPAIGALALMLSVYWGFSGNLFMAYWLTQWIALAIYYVNASADWDNVPVSFEGA